MDDSLSKSLNKLRHSSKRLNQLTDQANQTIREVETFLDECSLGITGSVLVGREKEINGDNYLTYLEYRRVGSRYRIAIVDRVSSLNDDFEPSEQNVKPWSDAPRDEKLETIKKLPDLLKEMGELLEGKIESAEIGLGEVSEAIHELSKREGGKEGN